MHFRTAVHVACAVEQFSENPPTEPNREANDGAWPSLSPRTPAPLEKRSKHGARNVAYYTYLGHLSDGHVFEGRIQRHVCFLFWLLACPEN